jgi:hypothetical protein
MFEYMRNGGFMMWVMLVAAIAAGVLATTRPRGERCAVLFGGAFLSLLLGVLGLSLGLVAVSTHYPGPPIEHPAIIAAGLGELANNGTFAAMLAGLLGLAALMTRLREAQRD